MPPRVTRKIFLSLCRAYFPVQPCPIVPRHLPKAEKSSRRSQTDRTEGNKRKVKYELQQIEIIGGKRGSDKDSVTNPHSRQTSHTRGKETLSQYSGFGGIKEVLNIGTDKPVSGDMEEPIRRLQELIDTYPYFTEAMKASVLTAFYTPKFLIDVVAKQIHATFKDNELQMRSFLEPSAGIGGFLPVAMSDTCGYAIEKTRFRV